MPPSQGGLSTCREWTAACFDNDVVLFQSAVAAVRFICTFARRKFDWLWKIPWMISRLDQPGVRDECIKQFDSVPRDQHHLVSIEFFGTEQESLRSRVLAINDDGTGMDTVLRKAFFYLSNTYQLMTSLERSRTLVRGALEENHGLQNGHPRRLQDANCRIFRTSCNVYPQCVQILRRSGLNGTPLSV